MKPKKARTKNKNKDENDSLYGKMKLKYWGKKKEKEKEKPVAEVYSDCIETAHQKLKILIEKKADDLENESGRERTNARKLGRLETMEILLEKIMEEIVAYAEEDEG
jgi:hypothetical protein